jgi:hypothetical protein
MVLREDDEGWLLHLLHLPEESDSTYIDATAAAPEVGAKATRDWPVGSVRLCLSGQELPVQRAGEAVKGGARAQIVLTVYAGA